VAQRPSGAATPNAALRDAARRAEDAARGNGAAAAAVVGVRVAAEAGASWNMVHSMQEQQEQR